MLMTSAEGKSFDRYCGQGKSPTNDDRNRLLQVFKRLKDHEVLAYSSGLKIKENLLVQIQEKL